MKFEERIEAMNKMYRLPVAQRPTIVKDPLSRMRGFLKTLNKEMQESEEIVRLIYTREEILHNGASTEEIDIQILTALADWFADMNVYIRSEAMKWGLPHEDVLNIVMDSNESKLGADGLPIIDTNGKFLKGPNYWKPEPKIRELLSCLTK